MKNLVFAVAAAALLSGSLSAQQAAKPAPAKAPVAAPKTAAAHASSTLAVEAQNQLVGQYCATCHSERGKAGGLVLAGFDAAHTVSWSHHCHFLLCQVDGERLLVRAIAELQPGAQLAEIPRWDPAGMPMDGSIELRLGDGDKQ